jgi:hypothetical protein
LTIAPTFNPETSIPNRVITQKTEDFSSTVAKAYDLEQVKNVIWNISLLLLCVELSLISQGKSILKYFWLRTGDGIDVRQSDYQKQFSHIGQQYKVG